MMSECCLVLSNLSSSRQAERKKKKKKQQALVTVMRLDCSEDLGLTVRIVLMINDYEHGEITRGRTDTL